MVLGRHPYPPDTRRAAQRDARGGPECRIPARGLGPRGVRGTDRPREGSFHDPGTEPIKVDATHLIVPRNTEYEIFTVAKAGHTLGAFFVLNHQTPLELGVPPVGPVAARAHKEGALIELDKHNWPWSMAIVPIMPVDLYELSNNHVWETDFAFRDFGEAPAEFMAVEKDARGFTERGWIEFGFRNYYALLDCGFRLRPTAGTASGVHPVPLGLVESTFTCTERSMPTPGSKDSTRDRS